MIQRVKNEFKFSFLLTILLCLFLSQHVLASTISISLNKKDKRNLAPNDLSYNGKAIDRFYAQKLKDQGLNLATLDPHPTNFYLNQKLSANNYNKIGYPNEAATLNFESYSDNPSEVFTATVSYYNDLGEKKFFTLSASLINHLVILNSGFMRKLGYNVDTPKYFNQLKINFKDDDQKDKFLKNMGSATLLDRNKWLIQSNKNQLVLKGLILEPSKLTSPNLYWPFMSSSRQELRRSFRALIALYSLTDFPQVVNEGAWTKGREFNNSVILNHNTASEFRNTTIEDIQWFLTKLSKLSANDLQEIMDQAHYPADIGKLNLEKIKSRINHLNALFKLSLPKLNFNPQLNFGNIRNGKLQDSIYADYVSDFYRDDVLSPFRFSEIFKFFKTQIMYNALSGAFDYAQTNFIPQKNRNDALTEIHEKINDYRTENGQNAGSLPLNVWTNNFINGRVFATRNIVFGPYLASNANMQIVDSIGAEVHLGALGLINEITKQSIPAGIDLSFSRTYSHVRPTDDIEEASGKPVKELLIPVVIKKLGKIFANEVKCTISENPFKEVIEVQQVQFYRISYDRNDPEWRVKVEKLRDEIIATNWPKDKIILKPINREEECKAEVIKKRDQLFTDFEDSLADSETFIINDQFKVSPFANINIPIPSVPGLTTSILNETTYLRARSYFIRKVNDQLEITLQTRKDLENLTEGSLKFYISLMSQSFEITKGNMFSKVYYVPIKNLTEEEKETNALILKEIFLKNNYSTLTKKMISREVDHDILNKLSTFKFLFWKSEKLKMNHEIQITDNSIVIDPDDPNSFNESTRTFLSIMNLKRTGSDVYNFFDRVLKAVTKFLGLGSSSSDPGKSPLGNSKRFYVLTESELTAKLPAATTSRVEIIQTGWGVKERKIDKIIDEIEEYFTRVNASPVIDRSIFYDTSKLRSYDFRTTFILYPNFIEHLDQFFYKNENDLSRLTVLKYLYGNNNWDEECERNNNEINYRSEKWNGCVPYAVLDLLRLFKKLNNNNDRKEVTLKNNKVISILFSNFNINQILNWVPIDSFVASVRITGFREDDPTGYLDYISNTVGRYNPKIGTGILDQVARQVGISSFELRAISYTPGMF